MTPTDTAVMPSTTMVRVSSRTRGVASGLPANWRKRRGGHPEQRVPGHAEPERQGGLRGAISATRPRHWTVAAIIPMSFTCTANAFAARARVKPKVLRHHQADQHQAHRAGTDLHQTRFPVRAHPNPRPALRPIAETWTAGPRPPLSSLGYLRRGPLTHPLRARSRASSARTRAGNSLEIRPPADNVLQGDAGVLHREHPPGVLVDTALARDLTRVTRPQNRDNSASKPRPRFRRFDRASPGSPPWT